MKLFKYMACGLLVAGSLTVFTACEDDNNLGEAPRLFSPVVSVSANANSLECTWQGIKGAKSYKLSLERELPSTDESGTVLSETIRTVEITVDETGLTPFSPYTFEDLDWDERYRVAIQAFGADKQSNTYTCEFVSVNYPTKVKTVTDIVDTGVKIEWASSEGETTDLAYINVFERNEDGTLTPYWGETENEGEVEPATMSRAEGEETEAPKYYYTLTDEDRANGYVEVYGLQSSTPYRVIAYNEDGEYRGRRDFKTQTAEVYPDPSLVRDLRGLDEEVADTIMCTDFFNELPEGAIVILKGGRKYVTKGTPKITKSVTIKTGMSLSGKATLSMSGFASQGDIANIKFENVKMTCLASDDLTSNFGGRYLFNHSNDGTIGNFILENVDIKYMRGLIRTRKAGQRYNNVIINNCTMDSIGGYGIAQCDEKDTHIDNFTMTNSTVSNAQRLLRAAKDDCSFDKILIENCTIYAVGGDESKDVANFLFDFGKSEKQNPNLVLNMNNCILGGVYMHGSTPLPVKAFQCNQGIAAYVGVYVTTDVKWDVDKEGNLLNFSSEEDMTLSDKDIWVNPAALDFTLKNAQLPCAAAGDPRWWVK